jgi:hypothetical protein
MDVDVGEGKSDETSVQRQDIRILRYSERRSDVSNFSVPDEDVAGNDSPAAGDPAGPKHKVTFHGSKKKTTLKGCLNKNG